MDQNKNIENIEPIVDTPLDVQLPAATFTTEELADQGYINPADHPANENNVPGGAITPELSNTFTTKELTKQRYPYRTALAHPANERNQEKPATPKEIEQAKVVFEGVRLAKNAIRYQVDGSGNVLLPNDIQKVTADTVDSWRDK